MGVEYGQNGLGDATETRAMGARARTRQEAVSGRAFFVALLLIVAALAGFGLLLRLG